MNDQQRVLSLLGLAARARKIVSGEELVIKGIQANRVFFVVIAKDAAENTSNKMINKCDYYHIPYGIAFQREELGHAIGKLSRVVVGVTDKGFAKQLEHLFE